MLRRKLSALSPGMMSLPSKPTGLMFLWWPWFFSQHGRRSAGQTARCCRVDRNCFVGPSSSPRRSGREFGFLWRGSSTHHGGLPPTTPHRHGGRTSDPQKMVLWLVLRVNTKNASLQQWILSFHDFCSSQIILDRESKTKNVGSVLHQFYQHSSGIRRPSTDQRIESDNSTAPLELLYTFRKKSENTPENTPENPLGLQKHVSNTLLHQDIPWSHGGFSSVGGIGQTRERSDSFHQTSIPDIHEQPETRGAIGSDFYWRMPHYIEQPIRFPAEIASSRWGSWINWACRWSCW